jgi:3'(2'), 5'-bisphosphate nucleotidase
MTYLNSCEQVSSAVGCIDFSPREVEESREIREVSDMRDAMLETFIEAALQAGGVILEIFKAGCETRLKEDHSPVTIADEKAEELITKALKAAYPDIPIIAEEAAAAGLLPDISNGYFILVDPLDGTKEFVNHREEFTVNIALIENGRPVCGVVYAPAKHVGYAGSGKKAEKLLTDEHHKIMSRHSIISRLASEKPVAVASRSHSSPQTLDFLAERRISDCKSIGSSLKFCLVAEGEADVYPRFGRTMEWDTAAGDAVLRAAGGLTVTLDGNPLVYGKRNQPTDSDFANPDFISWGRQ